MRASLFSLLALYLLAGVNGQSSYADSGDDGCCSGCDISTVTVTVPEDCLTSTVTKTETVTTTEVSTDTITRTVSIPGPTVSVPGPTETTTVVSTTTVNGDCPSCGSSTVTVTTTATVNGDCPTGGITTITDTVSGNCPTGGITTVTDTVSGDCPTAGRTTITDIETTTVNGDCPTNNRTTITDTVTTTERETTSIVSTTTTTEVPECPSDGTVTRTLTSTITTTEVPDCPSDGTVTRTITSVSTTTEASDCPSDGTITRTITSISTTTEASDCPSDGTITRTLTITSRETTSVVSTLTTVEVPDCPSAGGTLTITAVSTQQITATSVVVSGRTVTDVVTSTVDVTITEDGPTTTVTTCPPAPPAAPPPATPAPPISSTLAPEPVGSIVLCSSRIVNPTYTPPTPLPTTYHWGCPPNYLCKPPKDGCNFERGPPDEGYVCHPDECVPAPEIPDYANVTGPSPTDSDCAWYTPVPGYFNLDPEDFGLTYAIFDIDGNPVCEAASDGWGDSTWNDWQSGKPPHRRVVRGTNNPLARLLQRQSLATPPPAQCYGVFNKANYAGQKVAYSFPDLCPDTTDFQRALGQCRTCVRGATGGAGTVSFPKLQIYVNWCADPEHAPAPT